ncbi:thioredoxin family protein [Thiohalobacter sp. IOR34]|uniref:thioredoxin family protein n=1 Tax=Thiohalobacter sp. IOR34 TaxID=3057176 RepID=UPI0025B255F8|nr:thioredoxin family protein [Thiohalobacter sp. IOR34]WJW76127.1 thioredoxin family protein [Thiohalobacter sp. IOR34]
MRVPGAAAAWLLIVCWVGVALAAAPPRDPQTHFFDQTLGDFQEELATAREQGKQGILIFFEMEECPFCQRMRETVLNRPEVQDYFRQHFLIFSVDIEGDVPITDFQGHATTEKDFAFRQYRVRATPVILFFDLQGRPVVRYTGATRDAEEFLWLGEYVVSGGYQEMPFARYKRLKRRGQR